MTTILGIHDGHNAAATLLVDGRIVAAVQEERITRTKNQGGVPFNAIREVLEHYDGQQSELVVALNGLYMRHSGWSRDEVLESYSQAGQPLERVRQMLKGTAADRAYQQSLARSRIKTLMRAGLADAAILPVEHHTAHAAAAYFGSGWRHGKVLVLTADGSGDRLAATVNVGENGRLTRLASIPENSSIGRIYSTMTYLMGMVPLEHEYKIMGLAPYVNDPRKIARIAEMFSSLIEFDDSRPLTWQRARGIPPFYALTDFLRSKTDLVRFDLLAAGLQKFIEDSLTRWVRNCIQSTGISRIAVGGGVFMNVKANYEILAMPEVSDMFVFPSCGDETNSIGAAFHVEAEMGDSSRVAPLDGFYLGRDLDPADIEQTLKSETAGSNIRIHHASDIEARVADAIAAGEVVARVNGPMEFGARALGNRSILARPDNPKSVRVINDMIKNRDFWMPFAPSVLAERATRYYWKPKDVQSPYMMFAWPSHEETREVYPAAQHPYDHTARAQEVMRRHNPRYHELLKEVEHRTGHGIVLNTSFNLHGFPIAYTAADAVAVLRESGLRNLAIGDWWVTKS